MISKLKMSSLAVLGGTPRFSSPQHVGRPNLASRDALMERLNDILDRRWLSNDGKYLKEFESRLAELSGTRHAIAFCNATVAIEWLIRAMGLRGEIIVPAFTFIASAHAVLPTGCVPVLADVDPETHLLDPESVCRLITPKTVAIMGVHLWGQAAPVTQLQHISQQRNLPVIYDAAHALGATWSGKPIGCVGTAAVYSFHATKFVNSLEGGAVVTNDDSLAACLRQMRNFGFQGYDNVQTIGTNGKMDEFRAAVGLGSLEAMEQFIELNRRNWDVYSTSLAATPGIKLYDYAKEERRNYQYAVVSITRDCPLTRNELLNVLWTENVQARRYFFPGLHRMEPYCNSSTYVRCPLPGTELASEQVLVLPTGQAMQAEDIRLVADIINAAITNADEVKRELQLTRLPLHPKHPLECEANDQTSNAHA